MSPVWDDCCPFFFLTVSYMQAQEHSHLNFAGVEVWRSCSSVEGTKCIWNVAALLRPD